MEKKRFSLNNSNNSLRYLGLGAQMLVSIGAAIFIGYKADQWLSTSPLVSCLLPLLVLAGILYKLIRETASSKKNEQD